MRCRYMSLIVALRDIGPGDGVSPQSMHFVLPVPYNFSSVLTLWVAIGPILR